MMAPSGTRNSPCLPGLPARAVIVQWRNSHLMGFKMDIAVAHRYSAIVDEIASFPWERVSAAGLARTACAYYYFSVQFRENLQIACSRFPQDPKLAELYEGECDTDNLSPFPGVAGMGERLNHDEFMRRTLLLIGRDDGDMRRVARLGLDYLKIVGSVPADARARSIASYEDGGLEAVFRAILRAQDWSAPGLAAFRHFLVKHVELDSDPDAGHGALSRHMAPDDSILPLWAAFRNLLEGAVPELAETRQLETVG